jgi:Adaptin AP4 complex epsilon appendage platform
MCFVFAATLEGIWAGALTSSGAATTVLVHVKLWPQRQAADVTVRSQSTELAEAVLAHIRSALA